ncbi:hypothetical protein [Pararhodospirillum photometricum]|uniref:ATP-binding protein n=1 Tax=Pararhodospirillum photometricum DSM 122 TaxID=1150469 RepID=H6SL61_PARPM|nr:hypothetical protein [Pararhodospirillum photometricum]CCG08726.1 Putative uncharacterized protein [Pararhodospirillum photometricum DSM 122]
MIRQPFFRSVNLRDDLSVPERLSHYQPTRKSSPLIRAVFEPGATMAIATYGSGKSIAAGVGGLLVANSAAAKAALRPVLERLATVTPDLHQMARDRLKSDATGRIVTLSGFVRNVPDALAKLLNLHGCSDIEEVLKAIEKLNGTDRVAIIWDEFGRHLEGLINEGRARDLDVIQRLAEWAARPKKPSISLTLLLHQSLLAYAGALNQTSRNEWRKIEGRFEQIRFVEDSRELYEMIAAIIRDRRPRNIVLPAGEWVRDIATGAVAARWFDGCEETERVESLIASAYPLSSAALQVLPRLVARVGQNERSLFAFIETLDLSSVVGVDEVYTAFSDAMRSDVGIGGSHRRWVEAESARSRAVGTVEREALAAACILQLGADGERRHLPRSTLEMAIRSRGLSAKAASEALDDLTGRKLLLHRRLNDDVSIWHGADFDLATRIRDERARLIDGFELAQFLDNQHPAPFIRPTRHNLARGTARYLSGQYSTAAALKTPETLIGLEPPATEWGRVVYVLADTAEDIATARAAIGNALAGLKRVLFVLPAEPLPVFEAALEVDALSGLKRDHDLLSQDPLVGEELDELLAVARRQLAVVLHRLTTDRPTAATWFYQGEALKVTPERPAGVIASELMDGWYERTPTIVNDQIMRRSLSRQMQTASIRLLTRLMEHSQKPHSGYQEDDSSAEASVFRTVLERTGLHRTEGDRGRFAQPNEIKDPGMQYVWAVIKEFFHKPATRPIADLVTELSQPPIGMPMGAVPLIVMAGFRAFARMASLRRDGIYMPDLLGFESTRIFLEPERYCVEVHAADDDTKNYLAEFAYIFNNRRPTDSDEHVQFAVDALNTWKSALADGARRSKRLTDDARRFLKLIFDDIDPPKLVLVDLPAAFGHGQSGLRTRNLSKTIKTLENVRNAIDRLVEGYLRDAVEVVGSILAVETGEKPPDQVMAGIQAWVRCFDPSLQKREDVKLTDRTVLRLVGETLNGRSSPETLARSLSSVLLQRGIEQWQDGTADNMRMLLRECRQRIEDAALTVDNPPQEMAPIIEARIRNLQDQLERIRAGTAKQAVAAGGNR